VTSGRIQSDDVGGARKVGILLGAAEGAPAGVWGAAPAGGRTPGPGGRGPG